MSTKPIASFKLSGVDVAVWGSEFGANITIRKTYKDKKTEEYKESKYLSLQDAAVAIQLLQRAIIAGLGVKKESNSDPFAAPAQSFEDDDIVF